MLTCLREKLHFTWQFSGNWPCYVLTVSSDLETKFTGWKVNSCLVVVTFNISKMMTSGHMTKIMEKEMSKRRVYS